MLSGWIWRRTNISLLLPRDLAIPRRRKCILLIPLALQSPSRRLECIQLKVFDCSFSKSTTCAAHNHLATLVGWRVYTWGEGHFGSFNVTLPGTGESKEISPLRPIYDDVCVSIVSRATWQSSPPFFLTQRANTKCWETNSLHNYKFPASVDSPHVFLLLRFSHTFPMLADTLNEI